MCISFFFFFSSNISVCNVGCGWVVLLNVAYIPFCIREDREMTVQNTKLKDFVGFSDRGTIGVFFGF